MNDHNLGSAVIERALEVSGWPVDFKGDGELPKWECGAELGASCLMFLYTLLDLSERVVVFAHPKPEAVRSGRADMLELANAVNQEVGFDGRMAVEEENQPVLTLELDLSPRLGVKGNASRLSASLEESIRLLYRYADAMTQVFKGKSWREAKSLVMPANPDVPDPRTIPHAWYWSNSANEEGWERV